MDADGAVGLGVIVVEREDVLVPASNVRIVLEVIEPEVGRVPSNSRASCDVLL